MDLLDFLVSSYTKEAIELSTKLLEINPEAYTAWNYRKLAVEDSLSRSEGDPNLVKSIFDEELRVVSFLIIHVKFALYESSCLLIAVNYVLNSGRKCFEAEFQVLWCVASSKVGSE